MLKWILDPAGFTAYSGTEALAEIYVIFHCSRKGLLKMKNEGIKYETTHVYRHVFFRRVPPWQTRKFRSLKIKIELRPAYFASLTLYQ